MNNTLQIEKNFYLTLLYLNCTLFKLARITLGLQENCASNTKAFKTD